VIRPAAAMDDQPSPRSADRTLRVLVSDRQDSAVDTAGLAEVARRVLVGEGVTAGELSLSFVAPEEMAGLHARYLGEDGPTDVLSFPLGEDGLLGDVVVCPAEARRNNPADPEAELRLLVAHGVLHLLGYDHEEEAQRREMWSRQERYSGVNGP
jgi:probable rRNA maturation factor